MLARQPFAPQQQQGQPQQPQMAVNTGIVQPIQQEKSPMIQLPTPKAPSSGEDSSGGIGSQIKGLQGLTSGIQQALGGGSKDIQQTSLDGGIGSQIKEQMSQNGVGQLANPTQQGPMAALSQNQSIFNSALQEVGYKAGNPALTSYLAKANPNLDPTVTPWCAGFVGSALNANGVKGTGSLAAKSYLQYGQPTKQPSKGDIVVFNDLTGANNPAHGHVGFVDHIDQNSGKVITLGGNQDGSVSEKAYPLSAVAGFRVPPSGQQVKQMAQKNGINNPQNLSALTQQPGQANQQQQPRQNDPYLKDLNSTQQFIAQKEDYTSHGSWDVNHYRAGYGSDTYTTADGKIHNVEAGTYVSKEDASRDLSRRTNDFAKNARQVMGSDKWNSLSPQAQSALTSVAYNYGSLNGSHHLQQNLMPAIRTGDPVQIARAVRNLGSDNNGINKQRRNQEADMILQQSGYPGNNQQASVTGVGN